MVTLELYPAISRNKLIVYCRVDRRMARSSLHSKTKNLKISSLLVQWQVGQHGFCLLCAICIPHPAHRAERSGFMKHISMFLMGKWRDHMQ